MTPLFPTLLPSLAPTGGSGEQIPRAASIYLTSGALTRYVLPEQGVSYSSF